jgi:hypothetical protein
MGGVGEIRGNVLRARKRSSERIAMPFIKRTATATVSISSAGLW